MRSGGRTGEGKAEARGRWKGKGEEEAKGRKRSMKEGERRGEVPLKTFFLP